MKQTSVCDLRGRSILVGFKKKSLPTDPNFELETHIYFFWPYIDTIQPSTIQM